jgi:hypothetical protein
MLSSLSSSGRARANGVTAGLTNHQARHRLKCVVRGFSFGRPRTPEQQPSQRSPLGWVGRTHCWVRPPEEPDLRLSPHPARAGPSDLITRGRRIRSGEEMESSAGPLTATVVAASSLSVGSGVVVIVVFGVHLTTSALFRAGSRGSVSGRSSTTIRGRRALIDPSWFPAAFRLPALASWSSFARPGLELSSRLAYRPNRPGRDLVAAR